MRKDVFLLNPEGGPRQVWREFPSLFPFHIFRFRELFSPRHNHLKDQPNPLSTKIDHQCMMAYVSQKLSSVDLMLMSSMLWIAMEQHSSSREIRKGMFSDLLSEMCVASFPMLDRLDRAARAACDDKDISQEESDDLLDFSKAQRCGDTEKAQSILLKYDPHLLLENDREQAVVDHQFRIANQCEHRCRNLRADAHSNAVRCTRQPEEQCEQPDKVCPAREAKESVLEPVEMVA